MTDDTPLGAKELMARLHLSSAGFHKNRKKGLYRHLELKRPNGRRKYSAVKVALFLSGEAVPTFGRGSQS